MKKLFVTVCTWLRSIVPAMTMSDELKAKSEEVKEENSDEKIKKGDK